MMTDKKMNKISSYITLVFLSAFILPGCTSIIMQDTYHDPQPGYNLIFEAKADKMSVYPNEPILLTYELLTRYDTRYEGFEVESELPGFWFQNIAYPQNMKVERRIIRRNDLRIV